jgi:hypothetical protein
MMLNSTVNFLLLCCPCIAESQHNTHKNIPIAVHTVPPDDEQNSARNM